MSINEVKKIKRRFEGIAVGDVKDKTVKVRVGRVILHQKYKKRYTSYTNFLVHDEAMSVHKGDTVIFEECRPLSRNKRWTMVYKGT